MYTHHGCLCTELSRACIFVACHPHPPPMTGARDHSPRTRARTPAARMPQGRLTGEMVRAGQAWYRTLPRQAARCPSPGPLPRSWPACPTRSPSRSSRTSSPVRSPAPPGRAKTLTYISRSRQEARTRAKARPARCFGHGVAPTRSEPEAPAVRVAQKMSPGRQGRARSNPAGQGHGCSNPGEQARSRRRPRGPAPARSNPGAQAPARSNLGGQGRARSNPGGRDRSRNYPGGRGQGRRHLFVLEPGRGLLIRACGRPGARRLHCPGAGKCPGRRRTGQLPGHARASPPRRHLRSYQVHRPAPVRRPPRHLGPVRRRTRRTKTRRVRRAAGLRRRPRRGGSGPGLRPPSPGPTRRLTARPEPARPGMARPGATGPGAGGGSPGGR
jgi:hypothetical protein